MIPTKIDEKIRIRPARESDRHQIANLIHFEPYAHRHLDWRPPLDWIGSQPYLVAVNNHHVIGALASPIDPQDISWIRLFAVADHHDINRIWSQLWDQAISKLHQLRPRTVAAIPMQNWFEDLLTMNDFEKSNDVVMLSRDLSDLPPKQNGNSEIILRMMNVDDIDKVHQVDKIAFEPVWRNSREALEFAYQQSALATVAELKDHDIIGYSISTVSPVGGHLARLAVHPEYQSRRVGSQLTWDVLKQFHKRGSAQLTVNTQLNNEASIALYKRLGFEKTGEILPVYQYSLR